jgi:hypothetical protein
MPVKLKIVVLAVILSTTAIAQTACDSVYIKVAGMKPTQFGVSSIVLTKDLTQQIKRLYLSDPSYTISHFVLGLSNMCGGGVRNLGAEFSSNTLRFTQNLHSGERMYFDVVISGPDGKCSKNFIIVVR